jgi:hypothetical protein
MEAARVQNQILDGFTKLGEYVTTPGNLALADIRENVEMLFGKESLVVFN